MRQFLWTSFTLVFLVVLCKTVESKSLVKREVYGDPHHDPHHGYKDKAKVEAKWGIKNALLGLVFNNKPVRRSDPEPPPPVVTTTTTKRPTTTEDIVIFEKNQPVSLQIPGELFGSSFTLVTNLSNAVGDYMINSAMRAQRLLESMRPFLRAVFGSKGIVIEATTDKPIFSDSSENDVKK